MSLLLCGSAGAYRILMLGNSTIETDYLDIKDRPQTKLKEKLEKAFPGTEFTVINAAMSGEAIGPEGENKVKLIEADVDGMKVFSRYDQVLRVHKTADMIIFRYGVSDHPESLKGLCDKLKKDYPGAVLIAESGMYADKEHCLDWDKKEARSVKNSDEIKKFSESYGCYFADVREAMKKAADAGNWDLRIRSDKIPSGQKITLDGSKDAEHMNDKDKSWWENMHPNARGVDVITDLECGVIKQILTEKNIVK